MGCLRLYCCICTTIFHTLYIYFSVLVPHDNNNQFGFGFQTFRTPFWSSSTSSRVGCLWILCCVPQIHSQSSQKYEIWIMFLSGIFLIDSYSCQWSNLHPILDNNDIIKVFCHFLKLFPFVPSTGTCTMHTLKSLKEQDIVIHYRHLDNINNLNLAKKTHWKWTEKNLSFQVLTIFYITIKHAMTRHDIAWHWNHTDKKKIELHHARWIQIDNSYYSKSLNPLIYWLIWWHDQGADNEVIWIQINYDYFAPHNEN